MHKQRVSLISFACGLMALAMLGCDNGYPELSEVTGRVTWEGKPLVGASVQFDPCDARPASGVTDKQGNYKLSFIPGTEGASLGENKVRIYPKSTTQDGNNLPARKIIEIPAKFNEESELKRNVVAGGNIFDFDLTSDD